jgi:hypothetical protein
MYIAINYSSDFEFVLSNMWVKCVIFSQLIFSVLTRDYPGKCTTLRQSTFLPGWPDEFVKKSTKM